MRRNVEQKYNDADPAKVFDRAADCVCVMCKDKNRCWNSEYMETLSALNDATAAMTKRGTLQLGDIPLRFVEKCRTPEAFVTAVNGELRAAAYRKRRSCVKAVTRRGGSIRTWQISSAALPRNSAA